MAPSLFWLLPALCHIFQKTLTMANTASAKLSAGIYVAASCKPPRVMGSQV